MQIMFGKLYFLRNRNRFYLNSRSYCETIAFVQINGLYINHDINTISIVNMNRTKN